MSAKEMFKKLGYELNDDINNYFLNRYEYKRFNKTTKMFRTITIVNGENKKNKFIEIEEEFVRDIETNTNYGYLDIEELQAINKQIEELGWLND